MATHHIDEIAHVLTDVIFVDGGRIVLSCSTDDFELHFFELSVRAEDIPAARQLGPIHERHTFGRSVFLFRDADPEQLATLGEVRTPSLSDVFVAVVTNQPSAVKGAV